MRRKTLRETYFLSPIWIKEKIPKKKTFNKLFFLHLKIEKLIYENYWNNKFKQTNIKKSKKLHQSIYRFWQATNNKFFLYVLFIFGRKFFYS